LLSPPEDRLMSPLAAWSRTVCRPPRCP